MKKIWTTVILGLFLFGAFSGCKTKVQPPEDLIAEDIYIELMVELQLLESYQNTMPPDSVNTDSLKKVIFKKYTISKKQFLESKAYYQQNYKNHIKRVEKAIEQLRIDQIEEDSTTVKDSTKQSTPKVIG